MKKYLIISHTGQMFQTDYLKVEDFDLDYIEYVVNTKTGRVFDSRSGNNVLSPDVWFDIKDFGD